MQAQRQSLYKRIAARLRMTNIGLRKDSEVDNALTAAAERHERGDRFLTEYAHFSHRSQLYLHTILDLFVREPLDTTTTVEREGSSSAKYTTLANWLDWVHDASKSEKEGTFVMCSCTAEDKRSIVRHKLLGLVPIRPKGIPRKALAYLLSQETSWTISDDLASDIAEANEEPVLVMDEPVFLPSDGLSSIHQTMMRANVVSQILQDPTPPSSHSWIPFNSDASPQSELQNSDTISCHRRSGSTSPNMTQASDVMDDVPLSRLEISEADPFFASATLYWQSKGPEFKKDLDTYIWQPYRKPPPFNYVKFYFFKNETLQNCRMILRFNDACSLCAFRSLHQEHTKQRVAGESWSPVSELVMSISALFQMIVSDTNEFLRCCSREITRLTFESRAHPSLEKIQFLIHMNDRRKRAQLDMKRNEKHFKKIIQDIAYLIPTTQNPDEEMIALTSQAVDLHYVSKHLANLGTAIDTLQKEIESLNSLKTRNSSLLAFLAAVYVPIAFVTSFLGMNLTQAPTSLIPNSSNSSSTISQSNDTQPNSDDNSPTQRLWDIRWFPILAAPLLLSTIILPLVAGPSMRWFAQFLFRFQFQFGFLLFPCGTAYIIVYYIFLRKDILNKSFLLPFDGFPLACGAIFFYRALAMNQQRVRWLTYMAFALACLLIDKFVAEPVFMGMFAWLTLFGMLLYKWGFLGRTWWWFLGRLPL